MNLDDRSGPEVTGRAEAAVPEASRREVAALHSMSDHVRALVSSLSDPRAFVTRREDGVPSGVEQAIWLREFLRATAARVERLADDARPIHVSVRHCEPVGGYYRWSPDDLATSIAAEVDHLAELTGRLAERDDLTPAARDAVLSLTVGFLAEAVRDGEAHVRQAEEAVSGRR